MGSYLKGLHVTVHPLLVLNADQVMVFLEGSDKYGIIEVHNLDLNANQSSTIRKRLIKHIISIHPLSSARVSKKLNSELRVRVLDLK